MPSWLSLVLQYALPIVLAGASHPHAPEAHAILADAHTAASKPASSTTMETILDVMQRAMQLQLKAQALSGAPPTPVTRAVEAFLAVLTPTPPAAP